MFINVNFEIVTGLPANEFFLTEQVWSALLLSSSPISNQANEFDHYYDYDPC